MRDSPSGYASAMLSGRETAPVCQRASHVNLPLAKCERPRALKPECAPMQGLCGEDFAVKIQAFAPFGVFPARLVAAKWEQIVKNRLTHGNINGTLYFNDAEPPEPFPDFPGS